MTSPQCPSAALRHATGRVIAFVLALSLTLPVAAAFRAGFAVLARRNCGTVASRGVRCVEAKLEGYISHFNVESAVRVAHVDDGGGGWGLCASRKIEAGFVYVRDVIQMFPLYT